MATRILGAAHLKRLHRLLRPASIAIVAVLLSLTATSPGQAAPDPVVSLQPESPAVPIDAATFQVSVFVAQVTNPTGLGGYDLYLHFDPTIIRAEAVTDSGFVLSTGNIVVCLPPQIDNTAGLAIQSCVTIPLFVVNGPTATAPQLLATAIFQPVSPRVSILSLDGTTLSDPFGAPLAVTLANSQITVAPPPPPPPGPATPTPLPTATSIPVPTATEGPIATAMPAEPIATATAMPIEAIPTAAAPAATQAPPPPALPQPDTALEPPPTTAPSPPATPAPPRGSVTPTVGPILPPTGNGPGDGGSWVVPVTWGLAGTVALSLAAGLGVRAWRRRREQLAARQ